MNQLVKFSFLSVILFSLAACGFNKSPAERATWFFEKGENMITGSLEDTGASKQQITKVEKMLSSYKLAVTANMELALISHKEIMKGIVAGKSSNELVELENRYHADSTKTLRSIGKMHSELENIVGEKIWQAAAVQRESRFSR